jgi:hypothetical protein
MPTPDGAVFDFAKASHLIKLEYSIEQRRVLAASAYDRNQRLIRMSGTEPYTCSPPVWVRYSTNVPVQAEAGRARTEVPNMTVVQPDPECADVGAPSLEAVHSRWRRTGFE